MKASARPLLCIMGPTAAGKSAFAMRLAEQRPIEIISVDSAMVFRGMDIGTAKPDSADQLQVPHHLLDIRDPAERYSAAAFRDDVARLLPQIEERGRMPVLVGGTGLYFRSLELGLSPLPPCDPETRERIDARRLETGASGLHRWLQDLDPETAARLHPNDPQRLQRALEVFLTTGTGLVEHWRRGRESPAARPLAKFALAPASRTRLRVRIAERFQAMLNSGLVDEVRQLFERGDLSPELPAIRGVGYRQVWDYLAGQRDYEEMAEKAITATCQLAKRQYTWLRSEQSLTWLDPELTSLDTLLAQVIESEKPFFGEAG